MDWLKKHVDTAIVLGGLLSSVMWMNGRFNEIQKQVYELKQEVAIMKAVLILQKIMPSELAIKGEDKT